MTILKSNQRATSTRTTGILAFVALAGMLFTSGPAQAASQCKGLQESACVQNTSCGWVQSYERKDGRKVSAFCRTTARSAAAKSKAPKELAKRK